MSEWQPIETAPEEFKFIILGVSWHLPEIAAWNGEYWQAMDGQQVNIDEPTHWMPLPEPPHD